MTIDPNPPVRRPRPPRRGLVPRRGRGGSAGFTLIEMLGALAVGTMMVIGLMALIDDTIDDSKGQQAALYQSQVARAAARYVKANYGALTASATATTPTVVTLAQLKAANLLGSAFNGVNAYGQAPCVLVLQPQAGRLDTLVVTEGGVEIPPKDGAFVAANAGEGGGFIPVPAGGQPLAAQGAFRSWSLPIAPYVSRNCSGIAASPGRLASALFFDGPGNLSFDYLYRGAVPGHPELNRMSTPLHMTAVVVEDASDALCVAADATTWGRIAVDASGRVMSCTAGTWRPSGSAYWKDPVATYATLPATGNQTGDVRLVRGLGRAFSWNGTGWIALAVDQNGNLSVPGTTTTGTLALATVATKGAACAPVGAMVRDAEGLPLHCQDGAWRSLLDTRITTNAYSRDFTFVPAGGVQDFRVDLAAMPGPRPLYLTGYTYCDSHGSVRAWLAVEIMDAADRRLGYSGGCGAASTNGEGRVLNKGMIALQKIPENAARIRVYAEPGALANDLSFLRLVVQNSE